MERRQSGVSSQIYKGGLQRNRHRPVSPTHLLMILFKSCLQRCRPEHPFGEVITGPDGLPPPLYAQPMFHLLANIISSEVCTELMTVELALSLRPPRNAEFRILEWTDQAKRKPVFPAWGPSGPKDETKTPTAWGRQLNAWAVRYGLPGGLRTHDIRREALIKANGENLLETRPNR